MSPGGEENTAGPQQAKEGEKDAGKGCAFLESRLRRGQGSRGGERKPCWPQGRPDAKSDLDCVHSRAAQDKQGWRSGSDFQK